MKYNPKITLKRTIALFLMGITISALVATDLKSIPIQAATPMPTDVNVTDLTDAEVNAYYDGVSDKSGDDLLATLYTIIDGHNEYDYDSSTHRTIYKIIDRNWELSPLTDLELSNFNYDVENPFIRKLYADYNDSELTADRFKNDGASRVSFDKEHIWAQSLGAFGRDGGAGSDFHALWPADVRGNQQAHSNYNFAVPTSGITDVNNDKGTYVGRNGYISGYSQKVFEPLDEYKGDIARAMFYMPARYYEYIDVLHPKLTLVNGSPDAITASPPQAGLAGDLETLLAWHELDPVDEYEIHRNNLIYNNYQGNRNPFIDHPEWAEIAYDTTYVGPGASNALGTSSVGQSNPSATLVSIEASAKDPQAQYFVSDEVATTDFNVTATYDDSSTSPVTDFDISIEGQADLIFVSTGSHTINFSYTEGVVTATTTLEVNVEQSNQEPVLTSIEVEFKDAEQRYFIFDQIKTSDFTLTATYSDDSTSAISDFDISIAESTSLRFTSIGDYIINFSYTEGAITVTTTMVVSVGVSTLQIVAVSGTFVLLIGIVIAVPGIRKMIFKGAKKQVRKVSGKKK